MALIVTPLSFGVGLASGLASALLVISPLGGSLIAVPLTIVATLPLVIACLGWGTAAGIIAVLTGAGTLLAVHPALALNFTVFQAPPVVIGSHFLGLARPSTTAATQTIPGAPVVPAAAMEWYPLGRIVTLVALVTAIGAILRSLLIGFNPTDLLNRQASEFAEAYAEALRAQGTVVQTAELAERLRPFVADIVAALPYIASAVGTVLVITNLYLGARVVSKSERLARPWEDLAAFAPPIEAPLLMIAAMLLSALDGFIGQCAASVAGSLAAIHLLVGLSVVHTLTRGMALRVPLLVIVYLFIWLFAIPLILIGLAEHFLGLRKSARKRALDTRSR